MAGKGSRNERGAQGTQEKQDFLVPVSSELHPTDQFGNPRCYYENVDRMRVVESGKRIKKDHQFSKGYHSIGLEAPNLSESDGVECSSPQLLPHLHHSHDSTTDAGPAYENRTVERENWEAETRRESLHGKDLLLTPGALISEPTISKHNNDLTVRLDTRACDADSMRMRLTGSRKMKPLGGVRPTNTLKGQSTSQQVTVAPTVGSKHRMFDLHSDEYTRDRDRAPKRQRVEQEPTVRRLSSQSSAVLVDSPKTTKSFARSGHSISSQPRQDGVPDFLKGVAEYRRVNESMRNKEPRKKQNGNTRDSFTQNSRISTQNSSNLPGSFDQTDEGLVIIDDAIEELSPRPANVRASYNGTANHAAPRPKIEKLYVVNSEYSIPQRNGNVEFVSRYKSLPRSLRPTTSGSSSRGSLVLTSDLGIDQLSQEDYFHDIPNPKSNVMQQFAKRNSESNFNDGDIRPTRLKDQPRCVDSAKLSNLASGDDAGCIINILSISSGSDYFAASKECPGTLRFQHSTKTVHVFDASEEEITEKKAGLLIKLRKISRTETSRNSAKMLVRRSLDHALGGSSTILIEFENASSTEHFEWLVSKLGFNYEKSEVSSEQLDKIFFNSEKKNLKRPANTKSQISPDEVLLQKNLERRFRKESEYGLDELSTSSSRPHNTPGIEDEVTTEKKKLAQRMQPDIAAQDSKSDVETDHGSANIMEFPTKQIRGQKTQAEHGHTTRASVRGVDSVRTRARNAVVLSPSPERWTKQHPDYGAEWRGSLFYPPEGKKRAIVDIFDIERLDDGEFLNDNLITFYLRYLEEMLMKQQPDIAKKIFFVSTFFYQKLSEGKARNSIDYDAVKRWTAKVDIFSYDYIVVPICENLHWYLAIICHPAKVLDTDMTGNGEYEKSSETFKGNQLAPVHGLPTADQSEAYGRPLGAVGPLLLPSHSSLSPAVDVRVEQFFIDMPPKQDLGSGSDQTEALEDGIKHMFSEAMNKNLQSCTEQSDKAAHDKDQTNEISTKSPKQSRKKRRSLSTRKYNPGSPRIITLDSLGAAHSPVCTNLRDYLICEAKERGKGDIMGRTIPPLGMTVRGLPEQTNSSDCGVFLLEYMEKFMEDPESFIHDVFQARITQDTHFPNFLASRKRAQLRKLIFKLERDQAERNILLRRAKGKPKKGGDTSKSITTSSPSSKPVDCVIPMLGSHQTESSDLAKKIRTIDEQIGFDHCIQTSVVSNDERSLKFETKPALIERIKNKQASHKGSREIQDTPVSTLTNTEPVSLVGNISIGYHKGSVPALSYDGTDENELTSLRENQDHDEPDEVVSHLIAIESPDSIDGSFSPSHKLEPGRLSFSEEAEKNFEFAVRQHRKDKEPTPIDLSPRAAPPSTPLARSAASRRISRSSPRNPKSNPSTPTDTRSRTERMSDGSWPT